MMLLGRQYLSALVGFLACVVLLGTASGGRGAALADRLGVIAFEGDAGLYIVSAAGGTPREIPHSLPGDGNPRWSPDGKRLSFDRFRNGNWDVYVMNADGTDQRRLTFSPEDDDFATWSPDGRTLAFNSRRRGERSVYAINVRTGAARRVTRDGRYPDWLADGRIIFTGSEIGSRPIFTVRPWGANRRLVLPGIEADAVRASEDGSKIAYQWGTPDNIYSVRIDGSQQRTIAASAQWERDPTWSPDGTWIVFDSSPGRGGPGSIYVARADGGKPIRLVASPACCADWSTTAILP